MALLLAGLLLIQGAIPVAQPVGYITGVVRTSAGAPAAGVRVYAAPVQRENGALNDASVLEGLGVTDESGRYRLEVPAGRYYVAAGSVNTPTYFPGTTDSAAAREIQVTAGAVVEGIDFSRYIPPAAPQRGQGVPVSPPPGSTGEVSGVIRDPDGRPSPGVTVALAPLSISGITLQPVANSVPVPVQFAPAAVAGVLGTYYLPPLNARTDAAGRYRISGIPPGVYKIAAGFSDAPAYYPGTANVDAAASITTTPATKIDTLDFTIPVRPSTSVTGRVTAAAGSPAIGATVQIGHSSGAAPRTILPMPPIPPPEQVGPDGTFELRGVSSGSYDIAVALPGVSSSTRSIVVGDQPLTGVDFTFRVASISGRVLFDDGTAADLRTLGPVAVSTVNNPNMVLTTVLPAGAEGQFQTNIEAGRYRFHFMALSHEYQVTSMTAGGMDLLKEHLILEADSVADVEVHLMRRADGAPSTNGVRVRGTAAIGGPGRVQLCCFKTGPFERLSAPVGADGSFEFTGVPPGRYTVESAQAAGRPLYLEPGLDVGDQDLENLKLTPAVTSTAFPPNALISVRLNVEGQSFPEARMFISFLGTSGSSSNLLTQGSGTRITLPGGTYTVSVSGVPPGFRVKSVTSGPQDFLQPNPVPINGPISITVTIGPEAQ